MRATTPSGPGPTCRLCWMYLFGLTYANGSIFLVSSDFRRSTTCCLRLGGMGPPRPSSSYEILDHLVLYVRIVDHLVLYVKSSSELADSVAMGRRKLFTREDVLDNAIPIFWKH